MKTINDEDQDEEDHDDRVVFMVDISNIHQKLYGNKMTVINLII